MSKKKSIDESTTFSFSDSFDDFQEEKKVVESEVKKEKIPFKKTSIGKILFAIKVSKNENLLDDDIIKKDFDSYMVLQWLSMNTDNCELLTYIDSFYSKLTKEQLFKLLVNIIPPRGDTYDLYIKHKKEKNEHVENIAKFYEVGTIEARQYVDVMGMEWSESITAKYSNGITRSRKKGKKK
jgi:hypothetical protein